MVNKIQPDTSKTTENGNSKNNSETDNTSKDLQEPEKLLVYGADRTVSTKDKTEFQKEVPPYKIVTREQWGADLPTRLNPFRGPARSVRLIFTDSKPCRSKRKCIKVIKKIQRAHMRQGLSDIAYNFLVGGDIRIYEGRGWKEHPGITEGSQDFRTCEDIVIAYVGTFDDNMGYPEMADKAHELVNYGFSCGYMAGDLTATGGQPPQAEFASTGVDVAGCPEPKPPIDF